MKLSLWPEAFYSGMLDIFISRAFYCFPATTQQNKPTPNNSHLKQFCLRNVHMPRQLLVDNLS